MRRLRPWILPLALTAGVAGFVAWLHVGGVGRPDDLAALREARFELLEGRESAGSAPVAVSLPHDWARSHPGATRARYRIEAPVDAVPREGLGLYFPSINTRGRVWLNGDLVEGGSKFYGLSSHYWHLPLYIALPSALLRSGANEIVVELEPEAPGGGYLAPPYLGPEERVRPAYELRRFLQLSGVQILVIAMVAFGLFLALLYALRRKDAHFLAFAVVLWIFALGFYNLLAIDAALPKPSYRWLGAVTMAWLAVSMTAFVHRFVGVRRPRVELGLTAGAVLGSLWFALTLGTPAFDAAIPFWGTLVLAVGIYPAFVVGRAFARDPRRELQLVVASGLLIAAASVHDVMLVNGWVSLEHDFAIVWAAVVSIALFAYVFVRRFIDALDTSEALTAELEERVADKHAELERSYRSLRGLEQERAVALERERLMAEIHDGMGGQLVSTLAMVRDGRAAPGQVEAALREALDDMRLVIHSLDSSDTDVPTLLGMLRGRLVPRLEAAGVRMEWRVGAVPPIADFGPEATLHLMRIVQEAITNVVKHAGARTLSVSTEVETDAVVLVLADDGAGLDPAAGVAGEGRGIANMRKRAASIGAQLELESSAAGTELRLRLPRSAPA